MAESTVPNVLSARRPYALSMLPGLDGLRDILPKRSQRKRRLSVSTRKRDLPGHQRASPHGSRFKCICRKFNLCSRECRAQLLHHGWEFPAGTRVGFVRATFRIRGTGRRWPSWWVFRRMSNALLAFLVWLMLAEKWSVMRWLHQEPSSPCIASARRVSCPRTLKTIGGRSDTFPFARMRRLFMKRTARWAVGGIALLFACSTLVRPQQSPSTGGSSLTSPTAQLPHLVRFSGTMKDVNGNPLTGVVGEI